MAEPLVAVHHVRAALAGCSPTQRTEVLARAGLARGADASVDQLSRVVRALWDVLDDELMGLWPVPSHRGTFATFGLLAVHSPDLGTALRRGAQLYRLSPGGLALHLNTRGEHTVLQVDAGPRVFLTESVLMIWHRFSGWLVRAPLGLHAVELAYPPPAHADTYGLLFGAPAVFGTAHSTLVLPTAALAAPVRRDEAALAEFLRTSPADLLARREHGAGVTGRVRRALADTLDASGRVPGLPEVVARELMSPATLRRHLTAEHRSFRALADDLRRQRALASLAEGRETTTELAVRLGFSEPRALSRAVRRWTGQAPRAIRTSRPRPPSPPAAPGA